MFTAAAIPPVAPGDNDITRLHLPGKLRVEVFQRMGSQFNRVMADGVGVFARENQVGVDIIPIFPDAMLCRCHHALSITSAGCAMCPATTLAATTAGFAR